MQLKPEKNKKRDEYINLYTDFLIAQNWYATAICSDLTLDSDSVSTIYKKRWKVEEYHKLLKSNIDLAKLPTKKVKTQSHHI